MAAITRDQARVSIHGDRLTIAGDGSTSGDNISALLLDGKVIGTKRDPIRTVVAGSNGAGAITLTGAVSGDTVESVINLTAPADATASFEATISVAGQIQQTSGSNLSGNSYLVFVRPNS